MGGTQPIRRQCIAYMTAVSPLFAVEADALFAEGHLDEALALCRAGIEAFPEYAAAYVLTSRILSSLGRADEVAAIVRQGFAQSRRNEALRRIADELGINPYAPTPQDDTRHDILTEGVLVAEEKAEYPETLQIDTGIQSDDDAPNIRLQIPLRRIGITRTEYTRPLQWRASDLLLIPMPESLLLRVNKRAHRITFVLRSPNFPPFQEMRFRKNSENTDDDFAVINTETIAAVSEKNCTPLEELAQRLERARIPVPREETGSGATDNTAVPEFVTDTMAAIYERQGALTQALKAYQILARNKPEKLFVYQAKINEITLKIKNWKL